MFITPSHGLTSEDTPRMSLSGFLESMPEKTNSAISPQGIKWLAAMMYAGADNQTAAELKNVFHFEETPVQVARRLNKESFVNVAEPNVPSLRIANGMWTDKRLSLEPDFQKSMNDDFGVYLSACDFENELESVRTSINEWVHLQTNGEITSLFKDLHPDSRLVLVNTICFRSEWMSPFDAKLTSRQRFALPDGRRTEVMMMRKQLRCSYSESAEAICVELPYTSENMAMLFILPRNPRNWRNLEKLMSEEKINTWCESMELEEVDCMIPKMELVESFDLRAVFQNLGVESPFSAQNADFTKMSPDTDLFISQAIQNIRIEIDESGTTASAAGAAAFAPKASPQNSPDRKRFYANRPFWFVIRDTETGTIFFLGKFLGNPAL